MLKPKIALVADDGHVLSFRDVVVEAQDYDLLGYDVTQESLCSRNTGLPFLGTDMPDRVITLPYQKDAINNGIHEVLFNSASRESKRINLPCGKPSATSELVSIQEQIAKRAVA